MNLPDNSAEPAKDQFIDMSKVEKRAEELFYERHPRWPRRWGWIEVEDQTKDHFRQKALEENADSH